MALDNNPLKQYFRRPAVYIKLPSGGSYYPPGVVNIPETGELPVYPMTAIDEITTKTPDALFNGAAMCDLIKSCVPDIKDPWKINSIDLDAILIGIRAAGGGNDMEIESKCTKCEEISTYGVNLTGLLTSLTPGNYGEELQINDLAIKFRPLTYKQMNDAALGQFEVQRLFIQIENETDNEERTRKSKEALESVTNLTMELLTEAIEYIQTPAVQVTEKEYIFDFLRNCDKKMYTNIRDYNAELKSQTEIKPLKMRCIHCQHQYEQPFTLNTSDFFE
jgi:hypothetical protein